jgi:hypothetical protein
MKIRMTNQENNETCDIIRDVAHAHPLWVHTQAGTASESELQAMLDALSVADWYADDNHRGPDCIGLEMFDGAAVESAPVPDAILAAVMDVHRLKDSDDVDDETAERIFRGLYRRAPDDQDYEEGLWSHCLAWLAEASERVAGVED